MDLNDKKDKNIENSNFNSLPNHLELDKEKLIGKIKSIITREDVNININELLIVEFYSRK